MTWRNILCAGVNDKKRQKRQKKLRHGLVILLCISFSISYGLNWIIRLHNFLYSVCTVFAYVYRPFQWRAICIQTNSMRLVFCFNLLRQQQIYYYDNRSEWTYDDEANGNHIYLYMYMAKTIKIEFLSINTILCYHCIAKCAISSNGWIIGFGST